MSSTHVARCGIRSETSRPDLPCFLNVRVLASSGVSPLVNWLTGLPKLGGSGLPVMLGQLRLGVEQVDRARPADHEHEDDGVGRRLVVRLLGGERIRQAGSVSDRSRRVSVAGQQPRQSEGAATAAGLQQQIAARGGKSHGGLRAGSEDIPTHCSDASITFRAGTPRET